MKAKTKKRNWFNRPFRPRSGRSVSPTIAVSPDLKHVSSSLPREGGEIDYKALGIECVKSGPEKGKPQIRGDRDIQNIQVATHGRFQYDYRNDRATPFVAPR